VKKRHHKPPARFNDRAAAKYWGAGTDDLDEALRPTGKPGPVREYTPEQCRELERKSERGGR
jgi:hypothetical protein